MNKKRKQKKINVALSGAGGRMGKAVKAVIKKKNSEFVLKHVTPLLFNLRVSDLDNWKKKDITGVIDFSSPELFAVTLKWSVLNKKPFVSGTTALRASDKKLLKGASKKIPVFYEENMSWGIWQIKRWISSLSRQDYKILLEDIHHKNKKDKPSGTALKLQRHFPAFAQKKLKVKSIRKGKEFGTHRIYFKSSQERVLIEHKALDRQLFAEGALKALQWLVKKPAGLYSLEDLYG